jgi:hypothetical protein
MRLENHFGAQGKIVTCPVCRCADYR